MEDSSRNLKTMEINLASRINKIGHNHQLQFFKKYFQIGCYFLPCFAFVLLCYNESHPIVWQCTQETANRSQGNAFGAQPHISTLLQSLLPQPISYKNEDLQ